MVVGAEFSGQRVDLALAEQLGVSRSQIQQLVRAGAITRGGLVIRKSDVVQDSERLVVSWPEKPDVATPVASRPPTVLYSDDDIVVIDKPAELAVHAAPGWSGATVTGELARMGYTLSQLGPEERAGVVHRLDVGTSGVMVLARSDRAFRALKTAFAERQVEKVYHALVQGYPSPSSGTIDAPVGRHPSSSWRFAVVRDGKHAITHYDTLEVFPGATLVEVHLETGRTHQIRVHFQAERHPLVGDALYGADPTFSERLGLTRQWLHAQTLGFDHPGSGERVEFSAPYPEDLAQALRLLESV